MTGRDVAVETKVMELDEKCERLNERYQVMDRKRLPGDEADSMDRTRRWVCEAKGKAQRKQGGTQVTPNSVVERKSGVSKTTSQGRVVELEQELKVMKQE